MNCRHLPPHIFAPHRPAAFGGATRSAHLHAALPTCWRACAPVLACLCLWLGLCLPPDAARAQTPTDAAPATATAADPLADRMYQLTQHLRCLVCQNESLADSHAPLALDLKREIRTLMAQGQSDEEIRTFLTRRYGDFVNYQPPLRASTLLLWVGPLLMLIAGLWLVWTQVRTRQQLGSGTVDLVGEADSTRTAAATDPAQPSPQAHHGQHQGSAPSKAANLAPDSRRGELESGTAHSLTSALANADQAQAAPHTGGDN